MSAMSLLADETSVQKELSAKVDVIIDLIPSDFPGRGAVVTALKEKQRQILSAQSTSVFLRWGELGIILSELPPSNEASWVTTIEMAYNA